MSGVLGEDDHGILVLVSFGEVAGVESAVIFSCAAFAVPAKLAVEAPVFWGRGFASTCAKRELSRRAKGSLSLPLYIITAPPATPSRSAPKMSPRNTAPARERFGREPTDLGERTNSGAT